MESELATVRQGLPGGSSTERLIGEFRSGDCAVESSPVVYGHAMKSLGSEVEGGIPRWGWLAGVATLIAIAVAVVLFGSGGSDSADEGVAPADTESTAISHIHGLGGDPDDDSIFVATHEGLYRIAPDEVSFELVGQSRDDLMGFTMIDSRVFLASGHPAPGDSRPSDLGLIRSVDGGRTWQNISLAGEADFHLLRARGRHVYGFSRELMLSEDGGRTWQKRDLPPEQPYDLAVNPSDPRTVAAATADGIYVSRDAAGTWRRIGAAPPGLLAWAEPDVLFLVDAEGEVSSSRNLGRRRVVGSIGGNPTVFAAAGSRLLAALDDDSIVSSEDSGRTWTRRLPIER